MRRRVKLSQLGEQVGPVSMDPWLALLHDYVVVGEVDLPDGETVLVVSVHAAKTLAQFLAENVPKPPPEVFTEDDLRTLAQPTDEAWAFDVAFHALVARHCDGQRFIVGRDWSNVRLWDEGRSGQPVAAMFFTRAAERGRIECHHGQEERTWLRTGDKPNQLDHLFADATTAALVRNCFAANGWPAAALSDHAPLVADVDVRWPADAGAHL